MSYQKVYLKGKSEYLHRDGGEAKLHGSKNYFLYSIDGKILTSDKKKKLAINNGSLEFTDPEKSVDEDKWTVKHNYIKSKSGQYLRPLEGEFIGDHAVGLSGKFKEWNNDIKDFSQVLVAPLIGKYLKINFSGKSKTIVVSGSTNEEIDRKQFVEITDKDDDGFKIKFLHENKYLTVKNSQSDENSDDDSTDDSPTDNPTNKVLALTSVKSNAVKFSQHDKGLKVNGYDLYVNFKVSGKLSKDVKPQNSPVIAKLKKDGDEYKIDMDYAKNQYSSKPKEGHLHYRSYTDRPNYLLKLYYMRYSRKDCLSVKGETSDQYPAKFVIKNGKVYTKDRLKTVEINCYDKNYYRKGIFYKDISGKQIYIGDFNSDNKTVNVHRPLVTAFYNDKGKYSYNNINCDRLISKDWNNVYSHDPDKASKSKPNINHDGHTEFYEITKREYKYKQRF